MKILLIIILTNGLIIEEESRTLTECLTELSGLKEVELTIDETTEIHEVQRAFCAVEPRIHSALI